VFEQSPDQFKGHLSIIDRFLGGVIQPPTIEGALAYMGLGPDEMGVDGTDYAWAFASAPVTADKA
jgi:toluene monooxygenase system protein A